MTKTSTPRRRLRYYCRGFMFAILSAYFSVHIFYAGQTTARWIVLKSQIVDAQVPLAVTTSDRARRENLVRRMKSDSLDLDLLDERARHVVGLGRRNELIIFLPITQPDP